MQKKSQITGFLLTLLLGPFGLFYSSPPAALGLILFAIATFLLTEQATVLLAAWPVSILIGIWTVAKRQGDAPSFIMDHKIDQRQSISIHDNNVSHVGGHPVVVEKTENNTDKDKNLSVSGVKILRHPAGQIIKIEGQRMGIIDLGADLSS